MSAKPELDFAFSEWVGDLEDLHYSFDDTLLPIGALVGVYLAASPLERTTYALTHAVMDNELTLAAVARVIKGERHRADVESFDDYEFNIPSFEGMSSIAHHLSKAVWDGRPPTDTTITDADWQISNAVGKASYDYMIGFEPLRLLDTGRPHLAQLPRSFALIEANRAA